MDVWIVSSEYGAACEHVRIQARTRCVLHDVLQKKTSESAQRNHDRLNEDQWDVSLVTFATHYNISSTEYTQKVAHPIYHQLQ